MAAVDTLALIWLGGQATISAWLWASTSAGLAALVSAVVLAALFGESAFGAARLLAYGVFLHGPVVLAGSAWLLWPKKPKTAVGSGLMAAVLVVVAVDAFLIEPTWLEVSRVRVPTAKLTRPLRIVVLADLQTDVLGHYQREVLRRTLEEKPDLILLAGDYLHASRPKWEGLRDELNALLREIRFSAPAGAFAVRGNVDPDDWSEIFDDLPVTTVDQTRSFRLGELWLTCLSRGDSFDTSLGIRSPDPGRFHLVLGHSPNYALGSIDADLLVAGHTHGGQLRLPLVGPLITLSKVPRSWAAGMTRVPGGARLLVSRGVGMECSGAPRLRFLCRPELVVIDLAPE
jgi:predicted MPP superfamily phosphohydrolase